MVELLIWDLDGTMANSLPATIDAFRQGITPHLLETIGRPFETEDFKKYMGMSEEEMIRKIVGNERAERCIADVRQAMSAVIHQVVVFDGIASALTKLSVRAPMAVFTGRGRFGAKQVLEHLGIHSHFKLVTTSDDVSKPKPSSEGVIKTCAHFGVSPANAVMIGDSHLDVLAGNEAGATTIACLWDAGIDREKLHAAKPHHVVSHPKEIESLLFIER